MAEKMGQANTGTGIHLHLAWEATATSKRVLCRWGMLTGVRLGELHEVICESTL